jgi:F-type H+-transporting ATPase subunit delta
MKLTKEMRRTTKELFRSSFTNARLDEGKVRRIVQQIVATKPRHYVDLLKTYQRLIRLETEKHHAIIESATALDQGTSGRVLNDLKAKYGADLTTDFKINPDLLGGLRIRIGSDVWDGSVQGRLNRLGQDLAAA